MSGEIVISGVPVKGVDDIMRLSDIVLRSGYFGIRSPEEAAVKLMYGLEMGLPGLSAMMGVNVIQGRVTMGANLVASLIKRSGRYNYTIPVWDERECQIHFTENGKPVGVSSFSMNDAKRAGLLRSGGNWDKYPKAMLFARAITQGARAYCPDVFVAPVYDPDELPPDDNTKDSREPVVTAAETVAAPQTPKPPAKACHPLKALLFERFGDDSEAKMNATSVLYETACRNRMIPAGLTDPIAQYNALTKAIDAGELTMAAVSLVIDGGEVLDAEDVPDADPDDASGE